MGTRSKVKGDKGEREFIELCRRKLKNPDIARNYKQRAYGGPDIAQTLGGFVVEIKRQRKWNNVFWSQATRQAQRRGGVPALAYRGDWGIWVVMIPAAEINAQTASGRVLLMVDDWLTLVQRRERI